MKVFISHAFGGADEPLANTLKEDLGAAGIDGYLAERAPRYDLPISDKIRREINESDWLVAVITRRSHASASVHEEVGYALGRGVRVALMVEEGVEAAGVFTYGREYARFSVPKFGEHSRRMAKFIADSPRQRPPRLAIRKATEIFLQGRNVLSASPDNFAANEHYRHLHSPLPDGEKPAALFTACPNDLVGNADVTAPEFVEWVEATASVEVDGRQVRVPGLEPHVDIGRLLAIGWSPRAPSGRNILTYREFQSNGLFEFGTSHLFFDRNGRGNMEMHLCYMVGEFWSFLAQAMLFYRKTGLDSPFTAFVSVKNSDRLRLGNYGDEVLRRLSRRSVPSDRYSPATHRRNIPLRHAFGPAREATDEEIALAAKEMAKQVCNAYGETTPRCYNEDGSFSWDLWSTVARNSTRGG